MKPPESKVCPILYANAWSKLFHSWIFQLFDKYHTQKTLNLADLYDLLPQYESINLTEQLENNWSDNIKHYPDKPSLIRATIRSMGWKPWLLGCLLIPKQIAIFIQPLLLVFLMDFFKPCSTMSVPFACFLASLSALAALFEGFCHHKFYYAIQIFSMQMRIAYHGLIYRKILRLSSHSLNTFSSGEITNLFSNDAGQIEPVMTHINHLWTGIIDIIAMMILFWYFVKYVAFISVGYTVVVVLLVSLAGRLSVHFRAKVLEVTDRRVRIMSEIIKSMRIIKMYCWESAFERKIRFLRKHEIIRYALCLIPDCIQSLLPYTYVCITFLIMYGTMWSLNMNFDTRFFAVASCMVRHLENTVLFFGTSVHYLANYLAAAKRIQIFLLFDESERDLRLLTMVDTPEHNESSLKHKIDIVPTLTKDLSSVRCNLKRAQWEQNGSFSLKNIIFDAHPGDLVCVIGPVGCGKSSLLQTLTGEIPFFDGKVRLHGSFCYVPQEPWIFSSTVKKNIIFGKDYDGHLFRRVIRAAALEADFAELPNGMNTIVGDQGVMLSGGQKARVNMARALYRDADIYLLDDPLSAVDVKVSRHLFERSIKTYLGDKICILVTHQIQFLQDATRIIILENGEMVEKGTYKELHTTSSSFRCLLENIHQQEEQVECSSDIEERPRTRCVTFSEAENDELLASSTNLEKKQEGSVNWHVYIAYLRAGVGLVFNVLLLILVFGFHEVASVFYTWWLAKWSDDESYRHHDLNNCTKMASEKINMIRLMNDIEWKKHRNRRFYFSCGIALVVLALSILCIIIMQLKCLNSGRILHNKMFRRLIRCPISFFDLNPVGRILNRFTKDTAALDEHLPYILFDFVQCICHVIGTVALVTWLNPWTFLPAIIAMIGLLFIRHCFIRCSRDLKRLESTSRSPIYSYLTSTIHGLKVIRSYHAEKTCLSEFFAHLDNNTRANYLSLTTTRWAAIRFDWITVLFIALVTSLALIVRIIGQQFSTADIALTLSYSLSLTGLIQWTIRQSVEVETQMTSVERVLEYCVLDQEPPAQLPSQHRLPTNWPSHGRVVFNNLSMSHSKHPNAPFALSHISLTIQSGEKIGIVGRTGAGKSSFIQTLFRMGTLVDGDITIDNIDISTVGLDDVRRRISIIPQDPVLFTGTIRSNLDQFGDYSDMEIWHALEQVQLKKLVSEVMSNGLQSFVSESGSNLSVGQKQLVCLARAILKKSKILVIDEATANVDNATDELIQRAIREQFKKCTVLTIAHRLRTVIDSDRILVLGNGRVLEFDTPESLLSNANSDFSSLVAQTGLGEAEHLRMLANISKSTRQPSEGVIICNEQSVEDAIETDPLISSVISV